MRILLAAMVLLALAGCGRKGSPSPPGPPNDINYPKGYPAAPT